MTEKCNENSIMTAIKTTRKLLQKATKIFTENIKRNHASATPEYNDDNHISIL